MVLIVGGAYQGKLAYARENFALQECDIWEADGIGRTPDEIRCVNGLHRLVRAWLTAGNTEEDTVNMLASDLKDKIVICNDISCGIVPLDPFERSYRETTGRLLCTLAKRADIVIRMQCGLAQVLKGTIE